MDLFRTFESTTNMRDAFESFWSIKNIQRMLWSPVPEWLTLLSQLFLVNLKHTEQQGKSSYLNRCPFRVDYFCWIKKYSTTREDCFLNQWLLSVDSLIYKSTQTHDSFKLCSFWWIQHMQLIATYREIYNSIVTMIVHSLFRNQTLLIQKHHSYTYLIHYKEPTLKSYCPWQCLVKTHFYMSFVSIL